MSFLHSTGRRTVSARYDTIIPAVYWREAPPQALSIKPHDSPLQEAFGATERHHVQYAPERGEGVFAGRHQVVLPSKELEGGGGATLVI